MFLPFALVGLTGHVFVACLFGESCTTHDTGSKIAGILSVSTDKNHENTRYLNSRV